MSELDLDRLEALAKAATPGPWDIGAYQDGWRSVITSTALPFVAEVIARVWAGLGTTRYIAAMHPQTTLALIAELRQVRSDLAVAREHQQQSYQAWLADVKLHKQTCEILVQTQSERDDLRRMCEQLIADNKQVTEWLKVVKQREKILQQRLDQMEPQP